MCVLKREGGQKNLPTKVLPTATSVELGKVTWSSGPINNCCGEGFLFPFPWSWWVHSGSWILIDWQMLKGSARRWPGQGCTSVPRAKGGQLRSWAGWIRGQVTKPPLSLHRAGADPGPGIILGRTRQGEISCMTEAQGCRSPLCAQNYCSLGPPPASEQGCLCCASWSSRPLHKSKTRGGALTVWCPVSRRKTTMAAARREAEED